MKQQIQSGDAVIHQDQYGRSEGIADSDAMPSGNRIKVRFESGIRAGECKWVPLTEVSPDDRWVLTLPRIGLPKALH